MLPKILDKLVLNMKIALIEQEVKNVKRKVHWQELFPRRLVGQLDWHFHIHWHLIHISAQKRSSQQHTKQAGNPIVEKIKSRSLNELTLKQVSTGSALLR